VLSLQDDVLATGRSKNTKTGDIPTVTLFPAGSGAEILTAEEPWPTAKAALRGSCAGCPLLEGMPDGRRCYSHYGRPAMAMSSKVKAAVRNPRRYSLETALGNRRAAARAARISDIGDGARAKPLVVAQVVDKVRTAGLAVLAYTHFWRDAPHLRTDFMASCDSEEDAAAAISQGWRVALTFKSEPPEKVAGRPVVICPAMVQLRKVIEWEEAGKRGVGPHSVTCDDCRLCDASQSGPVIAFPDHGVGAQRGKYRR